MGLITPFQFVERFPVGKTVVFVGNAPTLRGRGLGSWIDSFGVVVRFNEARTVGFELDLGSRTDIVVTNPYVENRKWPLLDRSSAPVVVAMSRLTRRGSADEFSKWVGDAEVLHTYAPDLVGEGLQHRTGPTTGVYGVYLVKRILAPAQIALTGFTFFSSGSAHYWTDVVPPGVTKHDMVEDCRLMCALINADPARSIVTSDVAEAASALGHDLHKRVTVVPLQPS